MPWLLAALQNTPSNASRISELLLTTTGLFTLLAGFCWFGWLIFALQRDKTRHREGRCLRCGYDLRHCHDRCSECGAELRRK